MTLINLTSVVSDFGTVLYICLYTDFLNVLYFMCYPGSLSAQSRTNMSVRVGSTAVLPCDWRNISNTQSSSQTPHVEWCKSAETVFARRGGELYQGEGYEDRVDVPEDHLLKGDCSLVLKNVRPADSGIYESFLLVRRTKRAPLSRVSIQKVELSVEDASEEINSEKKPTEHAAMKNPQ
ncbi:versican core protein-like isoform X2 [Colossoma macropomum]|uniref:versican core protein-like isoform X2 n=1 Tax=Colossoma macropomum TaxID=42526 RepID=UPI0018654464|nr:versican core protein-like isoform X2 [Colossoma macropomum]